MSRASKTVSFFRRVILFFEQVRRLAGLAAFLFVLIAQQNPILMPFP
jgi:hypothetical protein